MPPAAAVAPRACPNSRVVSSIPDATPRCSKAREFMMVALFTGLNMLVPTAMGSISRGQCPEGHVGHQQANHQEATGYECHRAGTQQPRLVAVKHPPGPIGMKMPRDWLGTNTTVTHRGDMPNPSSTTMGIRVIVASMEKW